MKHLLLLSLMVINLPAAQIPQRPSKASLEGLPGDLKREILRFFPQSGDVLNIPALAKGMTTLTATSKSLHAAINNPVNMLIILKSLPKAGAKLLAERLQNMPGIKNDEVKKYVDSIQLVRGEELYRAVSHPNYELYVTTIGKLLDDQNINVNWKNPVGSTALSSASASGRTALVREIIMLGADVNAKSKSGWTALIEASHSGEPETVKILLAAGADLTAKNNDGETALVAAKRAVDDNPIRSKAQTNAIIKLLEDAEKAARK